ncbi:MAG TPA: chloride channel protein [Acidimicrobiia bacterium]|nr:chloride channel protein [Acidimicrobiia bacterium]
MNNPLRRLRDVPAVGALAEREVGGFLALSALVGVGVGFGAAGLILALEWVSQLIEPLFAGDDGSILSLDRAWIFLTVPFGLTVAWWVAQRFAPEIAGDGVPAATEALLVRGGHIRGRVAPLKLIATTLTVGFGGSAGREGPIVQIGAAIGSWLSRRFNVGEDQLRSLVAAGAGAGIGASFDAPIAGMLFALEVILVSFAPRHMSSVVIASVTAAITTRSIVGPELALRAGEYSLNSFSELVLYALLALAITAVGLFFLRFLDLVESFTHERAERLSWLRPALFGVVIAGLIFIEPALFGTGQAVTDRLLLDEQFAAATGRGELWWVLILLAVGKAVATSITISSGGSGGAFMPSLFMGAAVGAGFARFAEQISGGELGLDAGAFAVVGMAAMFAVVGRAPLTAILIVFEVTDARDYGLILPLMLVATLGTFIAELFHKDSVYTMALKRKGIRLTRSGEVDILDTVTVGSVMAGDRLVATPTMTVHDAARMLEANRSHGVPVVDGDTLVGVVTITDLTRAEGPAETAIVAEVMTPRPVTVDPDTPVSRALERMAALGVGRLPVVASDDPRKLVGMFRREEAVRAYHEALTSTTDHHLHRQRLAQRTQPGAGYYDFRVPVGSIADGRKVRDVSWPEESTLVSVRRGRQVLVPDGDTNLIAGDVITAFGTESSRRRMIDRLNAGADEPTAEIPLVEPEESAEEGTPVEPE